MVIYGYIYGYIWLYIWLYDDRKGFTLLFQALTETGSLQDDRAS